MLRLIGIVGTNAKESTNRKLLEYIKENMSEFSFEILEISHLPIMEISDDIPSVVQEFAASIEKSDGVIIAAPEYDHAPTAALLNALAWMSYQIHPLNQKPVLTINATYGSLGSPRSQNILKDVLSSPAINAKLTNLEYILPKSIDAFNDTSLPINEAEKLNQTIAQFLAFINGDSLDETNEWDGIL